MPLILPGSVGLTLSTSAPTVERVLASEALPIRPPRHFRRYHEITDAVERRAVVTLYLDGWSVKAIAGYLEASRPTVYDLLRRWGEVRLNNHPTGQAETLGQVRLSLTTSVAKSADFVNQVK